MSNDAQKIFSLEVSHKDPVRKKLFTLAARFLEKFLSLEELNEIYAESVSKEDDRQFFDKVLETLDIHYQISPRDLERIPANGAVVVTANHPFGGIEGIILAAVLQSVRPDVKVMANYMLERIPESRDVFLFVDPFGGQESARANLAALKKTISFVKEGGMLGIFPSGEVSHLQIRNRKITDPEWSQTVARIIRKTGASALPVYFNGKNGLFFQLLGLIHPRLRTVMLPHELCKKRGKDLELRIGKLIPFKKLSSFESDKEMTTYLRQRSYLLENRTEEEVGEKSSVSFAFDTEDFDPIIEPVEEDLLLHDVNNLPSSQRLFEARENAVYHASAEQVPNILREIGRLREVTFRETNEGTGKSVDLDHFDEKYTHLFIWNKERHELVGSYRLGRTDDIIKKYGQEGLYTTTLFNIKPSLFEKIDPALEMGRSFIRKEYQRSYTPLLLLWKGIGHYVVKYPKYKILFGPVSINKDYNTFSRHLMVTFLKMNNYLPELARKVTPKTPFRTRRIKGLDPQKSIINNIEDVSELVSEFENDEKGIPVLLKQYLKLGGKLLGFNVDPDFNDVLDGLILVDLTQTDNIILKRYMGNEGIRSFHEHHNIYQGVEAAV
ncbi:MAG: GNAT family N-acyltransferase [Balneolales bacterium]